MKRKPILWLTTTALFIALLIGSQAAGAASLGQFIAGPLNNLIMIVAVMTMGPASGLTAALLSPVFAKLLGIGPLWAIVPFIMAGNAVLVMVWHWMRKIPWKSKHAVRAVSLAAAAVCKFAVLYVGIVRVAVPFLLQLPAKQAETISGMFSLPQLLTAAAGGALAMAVLPLIEKVAQRNKI